MPKDPNHYIKEGFVPLSSHPADDGAGKQYELKYDVYWRQVTDTKWHNVYPAGHPYAGQRVCLNNCAVKGRNGIVDATKGAERVSATGWDADTVYFFLNNPAKSTLDSDGKGGYINEEYKFVMYPFKVPPSDKKDTTWSSTFIVHQRDANNNIVYNNYIVKEFVKAFTKQSDSGLFTSTQKVITNPGTWTVKAIVRG